MADIDVGQISEELNNKVDLPEGKSQSDVRQIIETYVNGTSGYRIWDDGYCEQWGITSAGSTGTVTLAKTFANMNYGLQITTITVNSYYTNNPGAVPQTENSFTWYTYQGSNIHSWMACGYLALGQY